MPFPFRFKTAPPARGLHRAIYSPIEVSFWNSYQRLRPIALRGLMRQYKYGPFRLDFAIPHPMIGIELDGHATHSSTEAIAADRRRQRHLELQGWRIIRFGGLEVFQDADACVREAANMAAMYRKRRLCYVPTMRQ